MKKIIKNILLKFSFIKKVKVIRYLYKKYIREYKNKDDKKYIIHLISKLKIYDIDKDISNYSKLLSDIKIDVQDKGLIYQIQPYMYLYTSKSIFSNLTIDYYKILNTSLDELYKDTAIYEGLKNNINNTINQIGLSSREDKEKYSNYFKNIITSKVESFEEALQRILWYNQILCQTSHTLMGLGSLDRTLNEIYSSDIKNKKITKESAKELVLNFCKLLHENYWFKSQSLMGDTGQVIVLGGKDEKGIYFSNDLTYMFIECIKELGLPDPKTLLRVSNNMPDDLLTLALETIKTGIGCPLFSNDEHIIEKLIDIGIQKEDASKYVTSACWEPLIAGKSVAQNNVFTVTFIKPFNDMLNTEELSKFKSMDEILEQYSKYLEKYILEKINCFEQVEYIKDEFLSLLTDDVKGNNLDISEGRAKYNNVGFTTVSMANLVESLVNIENLVFIENKFSLEELNSIRNNNFENREDVINLLKKDGAKYGDNDKKVIEYTNKITTIANNIVSKRKTKNGGVYKFGLSSPSYIDESINCKASLDGRKDYEPFSVHISSTTGNYVELLQFASKLEYSGHRLNGNVVDFIMSPTMFEENFEKFKQLIKSGIELGFYQMQMNVISSEMLIKAKANPELFPKLVVRVWGFSAYFNDLPEEYKDLLIERTIISERIK